MQRIAAAFVVPLEKGEPTMTAVFFYFKARAPPFLLRFLTHFKKSNGGKKVKNYNASDYAINKNARGIVYRFADQAVEITLEDYLRENPGKTAADFSELKALSDADYYETDRSDYRQTWKNTSFDGLEDTADFATLSPEDEVVGKAEQATDAERRNGLAKKALDKLTDVQRRRYVQHHVHGMTAREIAAKEGLNHRSVLESLWLAEKKIKKVLSEG